MLESFEAMDIDASAFNTVPGEEGFDWLAEERRMVADAMSGAQRRPRLIVSLVVLPQRHSRGPAVRSGNYNL